MNRDYTSPVTILMRAYVKKKKNREFVTKSKTALLSIFDQLDTKALLY